MLCICEMDLCLELVKMEVWTALLQITAQPAVQSRVEFWE